MKKRRALFIVVLAAAVVLTAAAGASAGGEEKIVGELVRQRTEVLSGYYDGYLSAADAERAIGEIEAGNLLQQDLENIESYFQTDVDRIKSYSIDGVEVTSADEDLICARVRMLWEVETLNGEDSFTSDYSVICLRQKDSCKLVQFF